MWMSGRRYFIVGGAGFIGSHFTDELLADQTIEAVTVFDSFASGRHWHVEHHLGDPRFVVIEGDVRDTGSLNAALEGHDTLIHLASNPDIAAAVANPAIDFDDGTLLTHCVVEAARQKGVETILYASGSGVYGELGTFEADEDYGPLIPVSTYAASKLAGEALLSSYAYMFGIRCLAFRFGNVVGPRQTHGVGFDFIRRLRREPDYLLVLGDGRQSKSYVHVEDVIRGVQHANGVSDQPYSVYNLATGDYITVSEIATLAIECLGFDQGAVRIEYTGGDRGWRGDVPVVRLNSDRLEATGWRCQRSSSEALREAMLSMISDDEQGLFD
jgi:UDP-glucose 4-epimerase|tara:strand:- start:414 stop:1397 length:984 start_codon:yes stop_codon:yes gene_type:complete